MTAKPKSLFVDRVIERLDRLDREQIEKLLRGLWHEREFLRDVFDRLTEGVLVLDADWRILWSNRAASQLITQDPRRRLVGESVFDAPMDDRLVAQLRAFAVSSDRIKRQEVVIEKPAEGILKLLLVSGSAQDPSFGAHLLIIEDLTEQRIEQARRQQADKIASLATLTAGVAHEIKNPLNALKIHAQLLRRAFRDGYPSESQRERTLRSVDVILEEIDRLGGIVEQFLNAARPTRPEFVMRPMRGVVERLAAIIRPELEQKRIELALDLADDVGEVPMEERQMIQALLNIVRNAIEAIETRRETDSEVEGRIEIRTREDARNVWLQVTDTGCGISEENLKRIAEPYYTTKFSGAGLGLMVVYRVIREHGGNLHIQSQPGAGTTITIILPRRRQLPRVGEPAPATAGTPA